VDQHVAVLLSAGGETATVEEQYVSYSIFTGSEVKVQVEIRTVIRSATRAAVGIRILRVRAQSTPLSAVYPGSSNNET